MIDDLFYYQIWVLNGFGQFWTILDSPKWSNSKNQLDKSKTQHWFISTVNVLNIMPICYE